MKAPIKRRHGLGATKRRAIVILFQSGEDPTTIRRLFGLRLQEVYTAIRKHGRR